METKSLPSSVCRHKSHGSSGRHDHFLPSPSAQWRLHPEPGAGGSRPDGHSGSDGQCQLPIRYSYAHCGPHSQRCGHPSSDGLCLRRHWPVHLRRHSLTPVEFRSHGTRATDIASGRTPIDIAFVAPPAADCRGNCTGNWAMPPVAPGVRHPPTPPTPNKSSSSQTPSCPIPCWTGPSQKTW